MLLPLVMPPVSTGLILLKIFGRRSPARALALRTRLEIVFNWKGVLIAMAVMSFPLLVRSVRTSFAEVNPRLEQIAATLGASALRIFFVITVPLAYKGIVAGALLAFSRALGEFGATILLAGNIPGETQTLSLAIYSFVQLGKDPEAYVLLGITVALAFLFVWCSEWLLRTRSNTYMLLRCRIPLAHFELDVDVTFDARVTSIFGPSGSGKTTLLDAIAGLRQIPAGEIEVNGRTLFSSAHGINRPPRDRGIGYVSQEGALFPHLSVRKNILFGANRDRYGKSKDISVNHVLDVLEIGNLLDRPVTKLSGVRRKELHWLELYCRTLNCSCWTSL